MVHIITRKHGQGTCGNDKVSFCSSVIWMTFIATPNSLRKPVQHSIIRKVASLIYHPRNRATDVITRCLKTLDQKKRRQ